MGTRSGFVEKLAHLISLNRWTRYAQSAHQNDHQTLRAQASAAKKLRTQLNDLLFVADDRLTIPVEGSTSFHRPNGTDWAWRPETWRGRGPQTGAAYINDGHRISDNITLHHDCKQANIIYRHTRNTRKDDLAAYGVRLEVFEFSGSFLSMSITLPDNASDNLHKAHMFHVDMNIETEQPTDILGRLNIKHGPNIDHIFAELPAGSHTAICEFDLGETNINEQRVDRIWLDVMFKNPEMNQITLRDLTICRKRRAEL